jgi:hypothetical protein
VSQTNIEELFDAFAGMNPFELADAVSRTCASEGVPIAQAAVEWVRRSAEGPLPMYVSPAGMDAVLKLLRSLPAACERYETLLEAPVSRVGGIEGGSGVLRMAVRLAPVRSSEDQWHLYIAAHAKEETEAGKSVADPSLLVSKVDARLAYTLLFAQLAVLGMGPPSNEVTRLRMVNAFRFGDPCWKAVEACLAIGLIRFGAETPLQADLESQAALDEEAVLGSRMLTYLAAGRLSEGRAVPDPVHRAMERAQDPQPTSEWVSAVFLLSSSARRDEVPALIARALQAAETSKRREDFMSALREGATGVFSGSGWGKEKAEKRLVPLTRALLSLRLWSRIFWARALGDPLGLGERSAALRKERGDDWVDRRSLEYMAWGLLAIAADPAEPIEWRRRAIQAIGCAGVGEMAKSLGVVKDEGLRQEVRSARARLSRAGKGHPVPPDIGLRLALGVFNGGEP